MRKDKLFNIKWVKDMTRQKIEEEDCPIMKDSHPH